MCLYGKFEKDTSRIDINEIINASEKGFVFICDAINEMSEAGQQSLLNILKQLNGELIIFRGNHDSESKLKKYETCENVIKAGEAACYLKYPAVKGYQFYLSHYPTLGQ